MSSLTILSLFALFSLCSATGHLRLELTASHDCAIHLSTHDVSETLHLTMGSKKTSSFHPKEILKTIEIDFEMVEDKASEVYHLKIQKMNNQKTFVFGAVVVIVESTFECDQGFTGEHCEELTTTTSSTTTTEATTTTTTTTTTEVTTTTSSTSTSTPVLTSSGSSSSLSSFPSTLTICLSALVICLLAVIVIIWIRLSRRQSHIYVEPKRMSLNLENPADLYTMIEKTPKGANGSPRYAPEPYSVV